MASRPWERLSHCRAHSEAPVLGFTLWSLGLDKGKSVIERAQRYWGYSSCSRPRSWLFQFHKRLRFTKRRQDNFALLRSMEIYKQAVCTIIRALWLIVYTTNLCIGLSIRNLAFQPSLTSPIATRCKATHNPSELLVTFHRLAAITRGSRPCNPRRSM